MSDVVVLIDRQQGGKAHLERGGIQLHAAFTLTFIVDTLVKKQLLTSDVADSVKTFLAENQTTAAVAGVTPVDGPRFEDNALPWLPIQLPQYVCPLESTMTYVCRGQQTS